MEDPDAVLDWLIDLDSDVPAGMALLALKQCTTGTVYCVWNMVDANLNATHNLGRC